MTSQTSSQELTAQARLEERLGALLWKETLGSVALGFTHDLNNLLTGILSLSETLLDQTDPAPPVRESLALIKQNALQASQLAHHLATLCHAQCGPPSYQDLNTATAETLALLRRIISKRIELVSEMAPGPLPVYVDAVQLRQATIALAVDAAAAMTGRGQIAFQTEHQERRVGLSIRCQAADPKPGAAQTGWTQVQPDAPGPTQARRFADKHRGALLLELPGDRRAAAFRLWLPESDFTEGERDAGAG
jgi:signal transduction histidine kinase